MVPGEVDTLVENIRNSEQVLRVAMAICYALSFFLNGLVLQWRASEDGRAELALKLARVAFLLAAGLTVAFCTIAFISPVQSVGTFVIVGVALVLAVITIAFDRGAQGMPALSFVSGAIIWLMTVCTPFLTSPPEVSPARSFSWLTTLHISTAIAGEGLCIVAFAGSLLYLWDYRRLKQKVLEKRPFLPSLDTLDRLVERTSIVGLFLITTSLVTGLVIVFSGQSLVSVGPRKIIWAFVVWGWYMLSIFGRGFWGWRGRRGAQLSLWGSLLLLSALFGTVWT